GAFLPAFDVGQCGDAGIERSLVDAEDVRAELLQHEGPASRAAAEIDAALARARPLADQGEQFPELEVGAARRSAAILDEFNLAVREWARTGRRRQHQVGGEQRP